MNEKARELASPLSEEFGEKWNKKYPQVYKSWNDNWSDLSTFFKYPEEVRRLIYTANAVEGFHRMLWTYAKTKTTCPSDEAVKKLVCLSIDEIGKNGICRSGIGA